jgi:hypothetical protein
MRGFWHLLAVAGVVVAQNNDTFLAQNQVPKPVTTPTPEASLADGYAYPTCKASTITVIDKPHTLTLPPKTVTVTKPGPGKTITTTCTETVYNTKTKTSTTTCTVVSFLSFD